MLHVVDHNKSDAQRICFLGKLKFELFLTSQSRKKLITIYNKSKNDEHNPHILIAFCFGCPVNNDINDNNVVRQAPSEYLDRTVFKEETTRRPWNTIHCEQTSDTNTYHAVIHNYADKR